MNTSILVMWIVPCEWERREGETKGKEERER
jgi:hypothetical protein